jgi:hypothetical protein
MLQTRSAIVAVMLVSLPQLALLKGQVIQTDSSAPRLSEVRVRQLLSKPNGLEACAKLAGEFVMRDDLPLMARTNLRMLTVA